MILNIFFLEMDDEFQTLENVIKKTHSDEIKFVKRNAPLMISSIDSLKQWIDYICSD